MSSEEASEVKDLVNERTRELHERDFLNRAHLLLSRESGARRAAREGRLHGSRLRETAWTELQRPLHHARPRVDQDLLAPDRPQQEDRVGRVASRSQQLSHLQEASAAKRLRHRHEADLVGLGRDCEQTFVDVAETGMERDLGQ